MPEQINRRARLTFYQRPTTGAAPTRAQTVIETPLRIVAAVVKSVKPEPNPCEIQIYNLSERTRDELARPNLTVQLEAGHDDGMRLLYFGDVVHAYSTRAGTEWVTQVLAGEGAHAYATARVNRSYPPGASVRQVLEACAASLGLTLPASISTPDLDAQFAGGYALEGYARDRLTQLLAPYGYRWSVQGGRLQILRDDQVQPGTAILIDEANGMIGAPELGTPERKTKKRTLTARVLLRSDIVPGVQCQIVSATIKTAIRAEKVKHAIDTYGGNDWTTSVEATLR